MTFPSTISLPSLPQMLGIKRLRYWEHNPVQDSSKDSCFSSCRQRFVSVVTKAVGDSSDYSSKSIVKYVQNAWNNTEDWIALAGLGFAAIVAFWASANLIAAIDKFPVISSTLEFIGILFSWWFTYRYLLFKPDKEELAKKIKNSISDIIGQ